MRVSEILRRKPGRVVSLPPGASPVEAANLMRRDNIITVGVPLPLLLGVEGHDRLLAHITERTGLPATSAMNNVLAAATCQRCRS